VDAITPASTGWQLHHWCNCQPVEAGHHIVSCQTTDQFICCSCCLEGNGMW